MILKTLKIINFRNHQNLTLSFDPKINIIFGNNGIGKTNLLESIYFLALTKSFRTSKDEHLIKQSKLFFRINGIVGNNILDNNLDIILNNHKKLMINNTQVTTMNYLNNLNVILFSPNDLKLIKGSPLERREYLNTQISQINLKYINILNKYNKILKQRNELLKKYNKTKNINYDILNILNDSLIKLGTKIYIYRNNYLNNINKNINNIFFDITQLNNFYLIYYPAININTFKEEEIIKVFQTQLNKNYDLELKLGITLTGPHRDDFSFFLNNNDLKIYGSQGQQRSAVIALKLAEIPIFKNYNGNYPILLLDDVFSELDDFKKNNLLKYISNDIQTFITTTDLKSINNDLIKKANIIKLKGDD